MSDRLREAFSAEELDALHEMLNIAMGRAASAIACLLHVFVVLSLPQVRFDRLGALMRQAAGEGEAFAEKLFVRQSFYGVFKGEVLAVYDRANCRHLAALMGLEQADPMAQEELMLDVSSVMIGACMHCFTELVDVQLGYTAPSTLPPDSFRSNMQLAEALDLELIVLKIHMAIKNHPIASDLIIGMSEDSMLRMKEKVARFIGTL